MTNTNRIPRTLAAFAAVCLLAACAQPYSGQAPQTAVVSNPPPVAPGPEATWYHVPFDNDSYVIGPAGQSTVSTLAGYLQQNPEAIATIIGKADTVGSQQYNMHLSHLRADAVRDALVYGGKVDAWRVETRWTGETRQSVPTADNTAQAANRVVDIAVH